MIMHQLIKIQENILLISFAVIKLYRIVFSFDNFARNRDWCDVHRDWLLLKKIFILPSPSYLIK